MRDPFAVACQAAPRLEWPHTKALLLVVASQPDGLPAWAYAAQLAAVLNVDEHTQEAIYRESLTHREHAEGNGAHPLDT